jgi:hypothetical protein
MMNRGTVIIDTQLAKQPHFGERLVEILRHDEAAAIDPESPQGGRAPYSAASSHQ